MSKPTQLPSGKWRVQPVINGKRISRTFPTKTEAKNWVIHIKAKAQQEKDVGVTNKNMTLRELSLAWLERYADQRTKGTWEKNRLRVLLENTDLGKTNLRALNQTHVAQWRDARLKINKESTVLRDWSLLSRVCQDAVEEMKFLVSNPFRGTRRPEEPEPRIRILQEGEEERLLYAMGDSRIKPAFIFAIETGMSAGEIAGLTWDQVHGRIVKLPKFKTRPAREVPLSKAALAAMGARGLGSVFNLTSASLDSLWRKHRDKAGVVGLHFHDLRAEAATRLSKKLNPLQLAKLLGHRDLDMLIRVYYRESVEDIAKCLD